MSTPRPWATALTKKGADYYARDGATGQAAPRALRCGLVCPAGTALDWRREIREEQAVGGLAGAHYETWRRPRHQGILHFVWAGSWVELEVLRCHACRQPRSPKRPALNR